jgi:hypothetical protein
VPDPTQLAQPVIDGTGADHERIQKLELRAVKAATFTSDMYHEFHDDMKEVKEDVKDLKQGMKDFATGQRNLLLGMLSVGVSLMGVAVAIMVAINA